MQYRNTVTSAAFKPTFILVIFTAAKLKPRLQRELLIIDLPFYL